MGNSKVSMLTSTLMNAINIAGNALLIFGFHMGVAGAAIASLFARMVGAVLITCLLRFKPHVIQLEAVFKLDFQPEMIKNILKFGVPTGLENGMFQIGRLMTQGLVATTAYMAKGLEFDMVIVPDADDATYRTETDRQSLYVACTRALHRLELLHTGWASELVERAQAAAEG